jgi:uncharacterized protein YyaL (SSP411 family)
MAEAQQFTNKLIHETSPYLLQHAHNPVDWYPWGPEALEKARRENKPIFLSVGYSACHWCHVMEHESFESEEIARLLNASFVSIKVDREERPDLDDIYMAATQMMSGSGGWPMSVFLTPDLRPFFAGTYFPPTDRWGRPGFASVVTQLANAWSARRDEVERMADQVTERLARAVSLEAAPGSVSRELVRRAVQRIGQEFDTVYGGFGGAPKFPPSMRLELIMRQYLLQPDPGLLQQVTVTLDRMARGGMYDQVGGGFSRYSVDERWLVPHFEKMLYDNALLAGVYLQGHELTGDPYYRRIASEIFQFVTREMTDEGGGFYSALDADSEGHEGKFYVWTPDEVIAVLGKEDGRRFNQVYDITPAGNFEGKSIPNLKRPVEEWAREWRVEPDALWQELDGMRAKLYEARARRVWPGLDDKILTSWNGLMIRAFALGFRVLGEERYRSAAETAATFALDRLQQDGRLLRAHRGGRSKLNGYLDDYAFLILGLIELHEATGEARWLEAARSLTGTMDRLFWDVENGGYFFTSSDHEQLLTRAKKAEDGAIPSGNSMAAIALLRLGRLTGEPEPIERAERILNYYARWMEQAPAAFPNMLVAADLFLSVGAPSAAAIAAGGGHVTLEAEAPSAPVHPGASAVVRIRLRVEEGWHINSHEPLQSYLFATRIEAAGDGAVELVEASYPSAQTLPLAFSQEPLSVYVGTAEIEARVRVASGVAPGKLEFPVRVRYQVCGDQQCLAPVETEVRIPLVVGAKDQ